jgi:hypothetical protein
VTASAIMYASRSKRKTVLAILETQNRNRSPRVPSRLAPEPCLELLPTYWDSGVSLRTLYIVNFHGCPPTVRDLAEMDLRRGGSKRLLADG